MALFMSGLPASNILRMAAGGALAGWCCIRVLKFATKRMRLRHRAAEDWINQLEAEIKQWHGRALLAETRLRFLERSIQQIAAEHVRSVVRI